MSKWSERQQARYDADMARDGHVEYVVSCPHPTGQRVGETGVNHWRTDDLAEAKQIAASHVGSRISRKTERYHIPAGKRAPRLKITWDEI